MTRILVVDDSAFMRKMISQMIESDGSFEIVGIARNGEDAVKQAIKLQPDIITLDIEMPVMDGLTALKQIKSVNTACNPHVLMCSSLTVESSHEALKALRIGASDVIAKDPAVVGKGDAGFRTELIQKLHTLGSCKLGTKNPTRTQRDAHPAENSAGSAHATPEFNLDSKNIDAVVIGSSTGGPPVLETILASLSPQLNVPILIAQHMPELFTRSLAKRLDNLCPCDATLAETGVILDRPGVYVAVGGQHLRLTRVAGKRVIARTFDDHPGVVYKPSVDLLFQSAVEIYGSGLLAIQLTGMGEDGKIGARAIRDAGGRVIAQDASSCVVYGMPKAVVQAGLADAIQTPAQIRNTLSILGTGKVIGSASDNPDSQTIASRKSA